jgi:NAD(P)-dependent dehydrogenase (short-subunit alcohol dehydrogenase family)
MGATEARLFASEGATVFVCDILRDEGEALAAEIRGTGAGATFFPLDVSDPEGWNRLAAELMNRRGKLDILINNAGITHRAGLLGTELADWQRVLGINLTGAFLGIRMAAPLMRAAGGGAIVNIASIAGLTGYHSTSYGVSKWGLLGLTKSVAIELADWKIRVNAVCPGVIETPLATGASVNFQTTAALAPQRRPGTCEEVAQLVLFLASDKASFITGEEIAIDGGMMAGALFRHIAKKTGVFAPDEA